MSPDFTTPPAGAQVPSMTSRCGVHVTSHRQTCASELTARHLDIFAYSNWHEASRPLLSWHTKCNAQICVENRTVVMYARSCFFSHSLNFNRVLNENGSSEKPPQHTVVTALTRSFAWYPTMSEEVSDRGLQHECTAAL